MQTAIIGTGFCGLAAAWKHLQQNPSSTVTLFDFRRIGQSTSGMAAGLLHPFAGAHAKLNRQGREGMVAAQSLLDVASHALGKEVYVRSGMLRMALSEQQEKDFCSCAKLYPEEAIEWTQEQCQALFPGVAQGKGVWFRDTVTVYCQRYLEGLWTACLSTGRASFKQEKIESLDQLAEFDTVIVAAGAETTTIKELKDLPLKTVRGQILELEWEGAPLPAPLNSQVYIVMNPLGGSCFVGATYEKEGLSNPPDKQRAMEELLPKAFALYPPLAGKRVMGHHAGLRAVAPQHLPLIYNYSDKVTVITGMGSKGLLYHALKNF